MAGYSYEDGMSYAAIEAYDDGKKPLSKITVDDLKEAGWRGTKAEALRLAKSSFWRASEWHHSGGTWYNRVNFYDALDLVHKWENTNDEERVKALKKDKTAQEEKKVEGTFKVWGGSRKHPTVIGKESFTGTLRGNWIYLDQGGRKKATGNHIEWSEV